MKLKAIPNPMRGDGCFVVKDVEPQPYFHSDGTPVRNAAGDVQMQMPPAVIPVSLPANLAHLFAAAPHLLRAAIDAEAWLSQEREALIDSHSIMGDDDSEEEAREIDEDGRQLIADVDTVLIPLREAILAASQGGGV